MYQNHARILLWLTILVAGCAGTRQGSISQPLTSAIPVTLDEGCESDGVSVSIQGAQLRADLLYVEYYRGHGCDIHTPQVCTDPEVELPALRLRVRDVTEDICEAEAIELIAVEGVPDGFELRGIGQSAVEGEVLP